MKRNIIYYIITILTALSIIGCSAPVPQPDPAPVPHPLANTVTFSGVIDSGRSAGVDLSGLTWNVEAVKDTKTTAPDGTTEPETTDPISATMNGKSWTVSLPRDGGKWTIYAYGKLSSAPNNNIYYGSIDVTADAESKPNLSIPVCLGTNPGTINLTVKKDSDVTSITKVEMKCTRSDLSFNSIEATFNNDGTATLYHGQSAGSYPVIIDFLDDDGNTLYQCRESISVLSDCTTDTWLGNSSYFATENGKKILTVTPEMVEAYGTECVPKTDVVVYNQIDYDGETRWDYSYKDASYSGEYYKIKDFCFDESGNLFLFDALNNILISLKEENSEIDLSGGFNVTHPTTLTEIAYDIPKTKLYGRSDKYFYEIIITGDSLNPFIFDDSYILDVDETIKYFTINNGIVYAVTSDKLFIAPMVSTDKDENDCYHFSVDTSIDLDWEELGLCGRDEYDNIEITDIIYQDGCVYMLLKEFFICKNLTMNCSSRGAVIKYDLITKAEPEILGWTSNPLPTTGKYTYLSNGNSFVRSDNNDDTSYVVIRAEDVKTQASVEDPETGEWTSKDVSIINLYAPISTKDDLSNDAFYGPQRFVAIRPKKLIIADDGLAFYTDELGAFCAKNVDRIVTVDLESFSIENNDIGVNDATFNENYPNIDYPVFIADNIYAGGFMPYDEQWDNGNVTYTNKVDVYPIDNTTNVVSENAISTSASVFIGNGACSVSDLFTNNSTPAIPIKD